MAVWVTAQDVLDRWKDGAKPNITSASLLTLIQDVEDAVLEVFPRIQERIDSGDLHLRTVVRVVSYAVIRIWNIGQEYRGSFSEATGPFSHSASYTGGAGEGVSLTDAEIKSLSPDRTKRAMSISMAPHARSRSAWLDGANLD
jgi:hypothetical protein